jgi:hypothetical protein
LDQAQLFVSGLDDKTAQAKQRRFWISNKLNVI